MSVPLAAVTSLPAGATTGAAAVAEVAAQVAAEEPSVVCRFSDERLTEISGITWSARHEGVYWVHNDSGGGPYLYAIDGVTCATIARIRVEGIGARDLEAIATGVDPGGRPVLWLGDLGDNRDSWPSVRLHAVPEPATLVDTEVRATTYRFTYSDGPHNAEAILADPTSAQVWVVTKQFAAGGVWRVPLSSTKVTTATRVAQVGGLVTDAAMSPDGTRYVIRDYVSAKQFAAPVSAGSLSAPTRVDLPLQPQGEAISFTADGTALLVASERDTALWRVPLPASSPSPSPSPPTTTESGTPAPSDAPPTAMPPSSPDAGAGEGGVGLRTALAAAAIVTAAAVAVAAARRFRR